MDKIDLLDLKYADRIEFGHIPNFLPDFGPDAKPDPILWRVLEVKKKKNGRNGKILLVSEFALAEKPYNDEPELKPVFWKSCTLNHWLNTDFINNAFSADEKERIEQVRRGLFGKKAFCEYGGQKIAEKIFILDLGEVAHYFGKGGPGTYPVYDISGNKTGDLTVPGIKDTDHPSDEELKDNICFKDGEREFWWLRDTVYRHEYALYMSIDGMCILDGYYANAHPGLFIRPALWLNIA